VLTTITTTRKFFTIVLSVLMFGHVLNARQWGSVAIVFFGLVMDAYYEEAGKRAKRLAKAAGSK
jgi:UDP-galactose transporter B1